mmetsp:Transcript_33952/g.75279  ORF Transcript_33952/g.75279 Transcript_33952/m.75279 type:complete len:214 (-) Transcript_33952:547-1188(-)
MRYHRTRSRDTPVSRTKSSSKAWAHLKKGSAMRVKVASLMLPELALALWPLRMTLSPVRSCSPIFMKDSSVITASRGRGTSQSVLRLGRIRYASAHPNAVSGLRPSCLSSGACARLWKMATDRPRCMAMCQVVTLLPFRLRMSPSTKSLYSLARGEWKSPSSRVRCRNSLPAPFQYAPGQAQSTNGASNATSRGGCLASAGRRHSARRVTRAM